MRAGMTPAERRFWNLVRAGRLEGLHFRRQVPIAGYIADFVCHELKLIVEIDGGQHSADGAMQDDAIRTSRLAREGYQLVRFWNNDVLNNLEGVPARLREAAAVVRVFA
jgi:very-short-patch-repair endonuclease